VEQLPQRVRKHVQQEELLRPGDRLGVAVSGGADSVALLRLLLELRNEMGLVLSVVHLNHKIRGAEAEQDQVFVTDLAREFALELQASAADVPGHAASEHLSLEAAGRKLRFEYFRQLMQCRVVDKVATAHTLDDQAETVLLRLIRGAGTRGLAGIYPRVTVQEHGQRVCGEIVRPLLQTRRLELREYLKQLKQSWREDASNLDLKHGRNRVRQVLLPLLEREFNPEASERLSELAEIARAEEEYWKNGVQKILATWSGNVVEASRLMAEPLALRRRLLRHVGEQLGIRLGFKEVEKIMRLAEAPASGEKRVMLEGGRCVVRRGTKLQFANAASADTDTPAANRPNGYEYRLQIPGEVQVVETGTAFKAKLFSDGGKGPGGKRNSEMFRADLLPGELVVRNWRPGDRFWPAHGKGPKKIKELLQEHRVPQEDRRLWPVVLAGDEIVWVRGFRGAANRVRSGNDPAGAGVLIEEVLVDS
jgi:tRNA(Ile)-lysidine synthase